MRLVANLFAVLLVLLTAQAGSAQSNYPNRPVKILVGFTPGTAPDLAARILADRFSEVWGTPFMVENVPGAGSNIATDRVAKAAAASFPMATPASARRSISAPNCSNTWRMSILRRCPIAAPRR